MGLSHPQLGLTRLAAGASRRPCSVGVRRSPAGWLGPNTLKSEAASMIVIRTYQEEDAEEVGRLIAATFREFNLGFADAEQQALFLGPFRHAGSPEQVHREAIARVIRSEMVFVAEDDDQIVGVLRGRSDCLASLFVRSDYHRQGIGRRLVEVFEQECRRQGVTIIRVAATEYAVSFYLALGYKRSTGLRKGHSFDGRGLPVQPMRKVIGD
jgi:predicted N-acetyltransferase YhbS